MSKEVKLFIDDEREPPDDGGNWVVVRSSIEAIDWISANGIPSFISFDHDLGGLDTAMRVVRWMTNMVLDEELHFPPDFKYYIHSQNPIGAANIRGLLDGFLREIERLKHDSS